jgi:hypothetical protein
MAWDDVKGKYGSGGTIQAGAVKTAHIANVQVTEAKIATGAVTATKLGTGAVTEAKIGAGAVTATKIGSGAVTAVKLDSAALKLSAFTGKNLAGACTLTGAKVGDVVAGVVCITDGDDQAANFETTITVADEIQQSAASNLSTKKYTVLLVKKGA